MLFSEQKPQCRRAARRLIGPRLLGRKVARRATGLTGAASVGPIHSYKVEKVWNVLSLRDAITNVQQCTTRRHSFREAPLLEIIEMSKLQTPLLRKESNTCSCRSKLWKSAVANVYSTLHMERSDTRA